MCKIDVSLFLVLLFLSATRAAYATESIGSPSHGAIHDAVNLAEYLKAKADRIESVSPKELQYSTRELADLIGDIAVWTNAQWGVRLRIGDLSLKAGGKTSHINHQNGLEADIGYIPKSNRPPGHRKDKFNNRFPELFVKEDGLSENFDSEKNLHLMQYINEHYEIDAFLTSCEVIKTLMTAAPWPWSEKQKLLDKMVHRTDHTDHFHVVIKCPSQHKKCENSPKSWWKNPPSCDLEKYCPKDHPKCVKTMSEKEFDLFLKEIGKK
jgi:murein endopeptidase